METSAQSWMDPDEGMAIAAISSFNPQSYSLMEAIFSETRFPVWEAAVTCFDPARRQKGYRKYIDMLSDQKNLATIAVKCPDIEIRQYAAAKLDDQGILKDMYDATDEVSYHQRILQLLHDMDFVAGEIGKMSPDERGHFFSEIPAASVAMGLLDSLPEDMTEARSLAQARYIELATEPELLGIIRSEAPMQFKDAVMERLIALTQLKHIDFSDKDLDVLSDLAHAGGEGNLATALLDKNHICWKCKTKMKKAGTHWEQTVHHAYSDDTNQKWTIMKCPDCGYEHEEIALRWQ
jgi:hypothetical protein